MTAIADAAATAPADAGVYLFFGPGRGLMYVGKASNLRRRLAQHARPHAGRLDAIYPLVDEVAWEVLADDEAAAAREALLILALRPAFNASLADDGRWTYIVLESMRLTLTTEPRGGRAYGCFPYLGVGVSSRPATACSDGYTALLRLLWAAATDLPFPAAIRGNSPPTVFEVPAVPALHELLAGSSDRLLHELDSPIPYLQPALRRDREAAAGFFRHGPRMVRELRLRHGIRRRTLTRADYESLLRAEVEELVGPLEVVAADPDAPGLGRSEARGRAIADAMRRFAT